MYYPTDVDLLFLISLIDISNFRLARVNNTDNFGSFISFIEGSRKSCRHTQLVHSHVALPLLDHTALTASNIREVETRLWEEKYGAKAKTAVKIDRLKCF